MIYRRITGMLDSMSLASLILQQSRWLNRNTATLPTPPLCPEPAHSESDSWDWFKCHGSARQKHPAIKRYLKQEAMYTSHHFDRLTATQQRLLRECRASFLTNPRQTFPVKGHQLPSSRLSTLPISSLDQQPNGFAETFNQNDRPPDWISLAHPKSILLKYQKSQDGRYIAYLMGQETSETAQLFVREANSSQGIPPILTVIPGVKNFTLSYPTGKSAILYYTTLNHLLESRHVLRRVLSIHGCEELTTIFSEITSACFVDIRQSKDFKYTFIYCKNHQSDFTSIYLILELESGSCRVELLLKSNAGDGIYVEYLNHFFYFVRTKGPQASAIFKLSESIVLERLVPTDAPTCESVESLLADGDNILSGLENISHLDDVEIFKSHLLILASDRSGLPKVLSYNMLNHTIHHIYPRLIDDAVCKVTLLPNQDTNASKIYFERSSPLCVQDVFELDTKKETVTQIQSYPVSNITTKACVIKRVWMTNQRDGLKIPVTLVHHHDLELNGNNPALLLAYGAYGISFDLSFRPELLSFLERGFVIVIAHIRGGGELGHDWHRRGRGCVGKNDAVSDLITVAHELISRGITSRGQLAGIGYSAGGLPFAAAINQEPDLFKAVVLRNAFLDPVATMSDPRLALTVMEHLEWGDPTQNEKIKAAMKAYSPYEGVQPSMTDVLLITSPYDLRVPMWQAMKYVAKRRLLAGSGKTYMWVQTHRAHEMLGREEGLDEMALESAFVLHSLGVKGGAR